MISETVSVTSGLGLPPESLKFESSVGDLSVNRDSSCRAVLYVCVFWGFFVSHCAVKHLHRPHGFFSNPDAGPFQRYWDVNNTLCTARKC